MYSLCCCEDSRLPESLFLASSFLRVHLHGDYYTCEVAVLDKAIHTHDYDFKTEVKCSLFLQDYSLSPQHYGAADGSASSRNCPLSAQWESDYSQA